MQYFTYRETKSLLSGTQINSNAHLRCISNETPKFNPWISSDLIPPLEKWTIAVYEAMSLTKFTNCSVKDD